MKRIVVIFFMIISFLAAMERGRIQGRVIDSQTNQPIPGSNVIIEGTELGAACDENGEYLIPYVPVGTYSIASTCMGYNPATVEMVVVISNQTTPLNFKLSPTIIMLEPVVTTAQKQIVIRTQTQTSHTTTADDISRLPVSEINEIITLQAGVSQDGYGTHIRGGRAAEIAYFVDGVLTKAPHYGTQSVQINKDAVEEIDIITGGFDAEYGEALSGVVNVVTREGNDRFGGNARFTTDELFTTSKLNYGYNLVELSMGGGLLVKSRFRYFLSGETYSSDAHEAARWKTPAERFDYKGQAKLSYRFPNAKGKMTVSQFYSHEQYMHYADMWGEMSMVYYLDHRAADLWKNWLTTATLSYNPVQSQIVEAKFGYTRTTRFYAVRDYTVEDSLDRQWWEDYHFKGEHLIDILLQDLPDTVKKHYLIDSLSDTLMPYHYTEYERTTAASLRRNPYGATGFYYTIGDERMWRYFFNRDIQTSLNYTNSIGGVHEIKTGVNLIFQNVGWFDNNLPWVKIPFWDMYNKNPVKGAYYIQDQMDFQGIIAKLGLRFDYFDSKAMGLANPTNSADSTMTVTDAKWRLSPRLGFSLPITDRSKMRFNYGHFFQTPTAHNLYRSTTPEVVWLLLRRFNSVLGNPNLTVEKTIAYEMGYENQLSDIYAIGLIAYYKDIYDLIQTKRYETLPYAYYQVTNLDYGNVKGIEFTLKKQLDQLWFVDWYFDFSYTLQFAKGTASDAWQHYYDIYVNSNIDPITGEYKTPQIDYWLDFDERHIVNTTLGFSLPKDFFIVPARELSSDFIITFHSGFPYTPTDAKGNALGDQNSARMPGYANVDANLNKNIKVAGLNVNLFANIFNLLDAEQVNSVFGTTGKVDDDGLEGTILVSGFSAITMTSSYYTPQADYNHDGVNSAPELRNEYVMARRFYTYENPFRWKPGFRMRVGIGLKI
ncbi:MAG TPA: TonB-dependent receptor [bacterium]